MNEALRNYLILTYGVALCACIGCWRLWRRWLNGVSASENARRGLACAYWLLAFTVLADLVASLKTQPDDITPKQFSILFGIAAGTMFQMVLVALILVPVAIRFAPRTSFRKALITLEGCAFISIVFWAIGVLANMHQYALWAK
jgi:hypothetical protein